MGTACGAEGTPSEGAAVTSALFLEGIHSSLHFIPNASLTRSIQFHLVLDSHCFSSAWAGAGPQSGLS